jgi:uncharacterized protein YdeI (BOF family)
MRQSLGFSLAAALTLLLGMSVDAVSQISGGSSQAAQVVRGDVLNIEGDTYTIKDVSGHEVQLRVDKETRSEERIKVGDKIEAQISSDGHAQTIRVAIP